MDQHPVPQNISSYEFRLVGDMTLKQFFQLAGGIGIGVLFSKMPLPFFLKWPLAGLAVLTGIMLAFVPVSGRPFSQWLLAFVRAIYSPTEYSWQASGTETPAETINNEPITKNATLLDKLESQVIGRVSQLFAGTAPPTVAPVTPIAVPVDTGPAPQATETTIHEAPPKPAEVPQPMEARKPIMVAEVVDVPAPTKQSEPQTNASQPASQTTPMVTTYTPQAPATPAISTTLMATPERPNIVAGLVTNPAGQPMEGVILEISDNQNGIPVRALRSNKLGQWQTATPLARGSYNLIADKEGFTFNPVSIAIEDKVISPLLIRANG